MFKLNIFAKIGLLIGLLGAAVGLATAFIAEPIAGIFMTVVIGGMFSLFYFTLFKPMIESARILKIGLPATATVLQLSDTGVTVNHNPQVKLLLEVTPLDNTPSFQAETKLVVSRIQTSAFQPGSVLQVKYDPKNRTKVAIDDGSGDNTAQVKMMTEKLEQIERENQHILAHGIESLAKVVRYTPMNINVNGNNPAVELFLEVTPKDDPRFNATARGVVGEVAIHKFQPGEEITVKYDPQDLTKVAILHS